MGINVVIRLPQRRGMGDEQDHEPLIGSRSGYVILFIPYDDFGDFEEDKWLVY